ncbi:hypothetical protein [Vreelandella sp. GE22]
MLTRQWQQQSQFGELPALNWHTYGSGHLHGLSAPGLNLEIDLEPDALQWRAKYWRFSGSSWGLENYILDCNK